MIFALKRLSHKITKGNQVYQENNGKNFYLFRGKQVFNKYVY